MNMLVVIIGFVFLAFAGWAIFMVNKSRRSGPENNWRNEDFMSREADGTWAEGSAHSKSRPGDSSGLRLP
jgi:hypothetical protein